MQDDELKIISFYEDIGVDIVAEDIKNLSKSNKIKPKKQQSKLVKNKEDSVKKTKNLNKDEVVDEAFFQKSIENLSIEQLHEQIMQFDECELKKNSKNTVIYDGVVKSKIMVLGEAPGEEEDIQGKPFVGKSGKLLDCVLESIGLSRKNNVYITNTVFYRPPANRKPTNEEIEQCRPFLEKQIALINPSLIIMCGATAMSVLTNEKSDLNSKCGLFFKYKNHYMKEETTVTAVYHPSFLIRNPIAKKTMWFYLKNIDKWLKESGVKL